MKILALAAVDRRSRAKRGATAVFPSAIDANIRNVPAALRFAAFVASHLLALAVGPWPAVLIVAAVTAAATWELADVRTFTPEPARGLAFRAPAR